MAPLLSQYLSAAARLGFKWGRHDCMLFAADWVRLCTGQDPAAAWRGRYASEGEANALLDDDGGPRGAMERGLGEIGWQRAPAPAQPGDVVLASVPGHRGLVAGIALGNDRVALLTRRGLAVWPVGITAIWRPAHG